MKRIFIIATGAMAMVTAHAASFDCRHAEAKTEKLICGSPTLSVLDEKMATAYWAVQAGLSAEERERLVTEQRRWIKGVRNGCADESCLEKIYASRIVQLSPTIQINTGDAPFERTGILASHPAPIGKGFPAIHRPIDDDLVYSHYDDNGNTRSIVQFDFTSGHWTKLVSGKTDPALIAQNADYIVFSTPHPASFPIEVVSRKSGEKLARIRLSRPVLEAFIDGGRLVLFQGQMDGYGYGFEQRVAILALPSLKLIQETTLPGYSLVGIRGNRIYTAYSANGIKYLLIFDLQFKELGRIQIPHALDKINSSCDLSIEQNEDFRAVLTANCGEMHILDLKSFSVVRSIRRYALFYSMALHDGLIFTTAIDGFAGTRSGIVVFDMETGKEIAHFPISASTIAIKGDHLLAADKPVSTSRDVSWPMETYRISTDSIRKGRWHEARVGQQCKQAWVLLMDTQDLYRAIHLCKEAGIEEYASGTSIPATVFPGLRQYGLWLSQTLDKGHEAVNILERVQRERPDQEVARALDEARIKAKVIGAEGTMDLTEDERKSGFGQVLTNGAQLANAITRTIGSGSFSNPIHFSGSRLYVGRYGSSTRIGIFDRNTFEELATVEVAPNDDEYQDAIASIVANDKHIYASVTYRYEQSGRPNFFVIDAKTLKITKRAQTQSVGTLRFERGKLIVCGCHFTQEQTCARLDPVTLTFSELPDKICVQNETDNISIVSFDKKTIGAAKFSAITRDYLIARSGWGRNVEHLIYPREGGQPIPLASGLDEALDWPVSVDDNNVVIGQRTLSGQQIKIVSLPSGTVRTLFGLPVTPSRSLVPLLHRQTLYVGYGRDLLIFDLKNYRLRSYIKDFIPTGFKDNGNGLDANRISRLFIDQGRLIALTLYGANSRITLLSDL